MKVAQFDFVSPLFWYTDNAAGNRMQCRGSPGAVSWVSHKTCRVNTHASMHVHVHNTLLFVHTYAFQEVARPEVARPKPFVILLLHSRLLPLLQGGRYGCPDAQSWTGADPMDKTTGIVCLDRMQAMHYREAMASTIECLSRGKMLLRTTTRSHPSLGFPCTIRP
jgi:hypothetical protein